MMRAYVQANTNGRLHPADEPSISPLNRGFLYGDAIYEVWRSYDGVLFAWQQHWDRLQRSSEALYFPQTSPPEVFLSEIRRTVDAFRVEFPEADQVYIRLQIARGMGSIGLDTSLVETPFFVILVQENKVYSDEKFREGLILSIARSMRRNAIDALNPAWKTGNYLNNILCLREAKSRGADEVLICNANGEITEAAVSNVAFVRGETIFTPPLDSGILAGITRQILLDNIVPESGFSIREAPIRPEDLRSMQECFLLSSTKDLTPVSRIDDQLFRVGQGSVTYRLKEAFARYVRQYNQQHPELRLF